MNNTRFSYGNAARYIHALNAILLIITWASHDLEGEGQLFFILHIVTGLAALGFTILQLIWHYAAKSPDPLPDLSAFRKAAIHWNHILIMFTALAGGVTGVILWQLDNLEGLHDLSSNVLIVLFLMHVAGVLFYQFTKGNTLARMGLNPFNRSFKE